ncbi:MAG: YaaA family protein, partial [Epsilonproteobacteria bacterium]|nr:YaaA family protein [Campylobacterota bacterium]
MKILFSPSEGKHSGGNLTYNNTLYLFETLKDKHLDVLTQYQNYITNCDDEKLGKLFGLKKATDIQRYKSIDILNALKCKAVERYNGVAYDYLAYDTLSDTEKSFIDQNLIIFSNLYGPISANYPIAEYKLKQGEKIGNFAIEKFYKEH